MTFQAADPPCHPFCLIRPHHRTGEVPHIGEGTWIGPFVLLDGTGGLTIDDGCDISSGVQIVTHSTVRRCISERNYSQVDYGPVHIGDHVFIGTSAIILMGSTIGHHSIIAAGAVVREFQHIEPWSLVAGVPARIFLGKAAKYGK